MEKHFQVKLFVTLKYSSLHIKSSEKEIQGRYFTSDNGPEGIENATHNNTLAKLKW
jgi:hypothetical protein